MPALGNRRAENPAKIKQAAKKYAPPVRKLPPAPQRAATGVRGSSAPPVRGGVHAAPTKGQEPRTRYSYLMGKPHGTELPGVKQAEIQKGREYRAAQRQKAEGGNPVAALLNAPAKYLAAPIGAAEQKGWRTLLGKKVGGFIGNRAAEVINIPTQVLPAMYHTGYAVGRKIEGEGKPLSELGKSFEKESVFFHPLHALSAHPLMAGLEVSGGLSAADRAAGFLSRSSLKDVGATTVSRQPRTVLGNASEPLKPYDTGLVRKKTEMKLGRRKLRPYEVSHKLKTQYDKMESYLLQITRNDRSDTIHAHTRLLKGGKTKDGTVKGGYLGREVPGAGAVALHSHGLLADPSILTKEGIPLYRLQLQELRDHYTQAHPHETAEGEVVRKQVLSHIDELIHDQTYHERPDLAYQVSKQIAARKRALEPELEKHNIYTAKQMRAAKLPGAFRFHFRNEGATFDAAPEPGHSHFLLNGKEVSTDEVVRKLKEKGVSEGQLGFVSTRPFQNPHTAFVSGHYPGGKQLHKGILTGSRLMRGHFDPTTDALLRQELTDRALINRAHGDYAKAHNFILTKSHVADLIDEGLKTNKNLSESQRGKLREEVAKLRSGGVYFEGNAGMSPWEEATTHVGNARQANPNIPLVPVRTVHPYAQKAYRENLNERVGNNLDAIDDVLDPNKFESTQRYWQDQFHSGGGADDGPVGLIHARLAQRMKQFERDTGSNHFLRMPSSFWRKVNVAFSVRHVPGVSAELGYRAIANKIGAASYLRSHKVADTLHELESHPDPNVKFGVKRFKAMTRGTRIADLEQMTRHINENQISQNLAGDVAREARVLGERKLVGAPLRLVQKTARGSMKVTNTILAAERRGIEHQFQFAGVGKHFAQEYHRLTGNHLPILKAFNGVEQQFVKGLVDEKALDYLAQRLVDYYGEWGKSTPGLKKAMAVMPFYTWYKNAVRFIYKTLPKDHPLKTAALVAMENMTQEDRKREGQGYKSFFEPLEHGLEPSQQGSIPAGPEGVVSQQYYAPQGAVSEGYEGPLKSIVPYVKDPGLVLLGIDPLTLKERQIKKGGKKVPPTLNQRAWEAIKEEESNMAPPIRVFENAQQRGLAHAFRPFKTEKQRTMLNPGERKKKKESVGGWGGGPSGGSGGWAAQ